MLPAIVHALELDDAPRIGYTIDAMETQGRISDMITARRKQAGLTIYKLAKLANLKWETLRDLERGRRRPNSLTLQKLDAALQKLGV